MQQALQAEHRLAYTTVLTVLDRMARKGLVRRRLSGRCFVYTPGVSREDLRRAAVRELIRSYFEGSEEEFLAFLRNQTPAAGAATAALDPVLL